MYPLCSVNMLTRCLLITVILVETIRSGDVRPKKETRLPDYSVYHNVSQIQLALLKLTNRAPGYIRLISSFLSREGRPQLLLRITNFTHNQLQPSHDMGPSREKVKILLSYGEHAREFFPVESLIYLVGNLTGGLDATVSEAAREFSRVILSNIDLFIVAMMNPDGRCYVERTGNYCWRGTITGVDLNRNFDWNFGKHGSSSNHRDEEYRGPRAFSEPECNILLNLTARFSFDAFVSLHSGIRQIYVPFADSVSKQTRYKPANLDGMLDIAQKMSRATSKKFTYGLAYYLNDYTADGTIFDYMAGVRKVPFSFAIELWGDLKKQAVCFDLFNPANENLQAEVKQVHPIYEVLFLHLIKWKQKQTAFIPHTQKDRPLSHSFRYTVLLCVGLLAVYLALHNKRSLSFWLRRRRRVIRVHSLGSMFSSLKT